MLRINVERTVFKVSCLHSENKLTSHWKYRCILTGMCLWVLLERAGIELKTDF